MTRGLGHPDGHVGKVRALTDAATTAFRLISKQ